MNNPFWKNETLDKLERDAQGGDWLRGLPRRDFPWTVFKEAFSDAEGDNWSVVVLCHAVEPGRDAKVVRVRVELKADCTVSDENLEKMGLSPSRLRAMHDDAPASFADGATRTTELPLDDLEKACRRWVASARADLVLRYTFNKKQKIIWERVRKRPLSRFSHPAD
ncbi:MAG: hypothetical protein IOD12_18050 [Silvanigrellales bacterium]|nr:hypothetical protein [Silvanigrellales bacterium]